MDSLPVKAEISRLCCGIWIMSAQSIHRQPKLPPPHHHPTNQIALRTTQQVTPRTNPAHNSKPTPGPELRVAGAPATHNSGVSTHRGLILAPSQAITPQAKLLYVQLKNCSTYNSTNYPTYKSNAQLQADPRTRVCLLYTSDAADEHRDVVF